MSYKAVGKRTNSPQKNRSRSLELVHVALETLGRILKSVWHAKEFEETKLVIMAVLSRDASSTCTCWNACRRSILLNTEHPAKRSLKVVSAGRGYQSSLVMGSLLPVVDPQLPREQAGFRPGRSTVEQVVKLTEDIETAFENRKKCGAVFVDLSAAYDTVWHRGLALKMLQLIPNKHMVQFTRELITNRSFKLYVGKDSSKTYTIKNGVPQGSVLALMLFNIYIYMYDIPKTASTKYMYADDIALMESGLNYAEIQQTLTNDLTNLDMYLQRWRLRLNVENTVSSCFHLTNFLAKHQMEVSCGGNTIPTTSNPKYLGVTHDRSLTYTKHLSQLSLKVNARCNSLRRLAGTKWGAHFDVLQTSTTALAFAPAEYAHQCGIEVPTHIDSMQF